MESDCVVRTLEGKRGEEVAGLPVAGCTALLLAEKAGLKRGDSVLVWSERGCWAYGYADGTRGGGVEWEGSGGL